MFSNAKTPAFQNQYVPSNRSQRTSARPMAITATPAPAALLATAAPVKEACEKALLVVVLALCVLVALAVDATLLPEPVFVIIGDDVARAALCSDNTEATPLADVATLGMPVMIPAEFVIVV